MPSLRRSLSLLGLSALALALALTGSGRSRVCWCLLTIRRSKGLRCLRLCKCILVLPGELRGRHGTCFVMHYSCVRALRLVASCLVTRAFAMMPLVRGMQYLFCQCCLTH